MKTSEILIKARAALRDRGWCRTWYATTGGVDANGHTLGIRSHIPLPGDAQAKAFCAVGALMFAGDVDAQLTTTPAILALVDAGKLRGAAEREEGYDRGPRYDVSAWNNDPATSREDVLRVFEIAIDQAQAQEAE